MTEFINTLLVYWNGFSTVSQSVIGQLGLKITGKEIATSTTHWIFYGTILAILIVMIRARRANVRNQVETRQRFDG